MEENYNKLPLKSEPEINQQEELENNLSYYYKALKTFKDNNDSQGEADTLFEIADVYMDLNYYKEALKFYEKSLNLYKFNRDLIGQGYASTGIGLFYLSQNEYEEAREYFNKAIKKFKRKKDKDKDYLFCS